MAINPPPIQEITTDGAGRFPQIWIKWFLSLFNYLTFCGAFGYLQNTTETIVSADTYQALSTLHTVDSVSNFTQGVAYAPSLKYANTLTRSFEVDWHVTIIAPSNTSTVEMALFKNGTIINGSQSGTLCKNSSEEYNFSSTCVVELEKGDEIQFQIKSDKTGDFTIKYKTATIRNFG